MPRTALLASGVNVSLRSGPPVVEDIDMQVAAGEIVGIVGESGSGKTTTALALLGYTRPGLTITNGSVRVGGEELLGRPAGELRRLRGRLISYVPQDPSASLNPSVRVGRQLSMMATEHRRDWDASELPGAFERVGLPSTAAFARCYPHQLSGGQQQRVVIAKALVCRPAVVVLDEPTTGLDVVTQAIVLDEIKRLSSEADVGMVYVSHDLAVVGKIAGRIAVMYGGRIVEYGLTANLVDTPRHPYTRALVMANPDHLEPRPLRGIAGTAVGVGDRPPGCSFAPRCGQRVDACEVRVPELEPTVHGGSVRCIRWNETPAVMREPIRHATSRADPAPVLATESLRADYAVRGGRITAVSNLTITVGSRECVAIVGESGSGKTTVARCLVGLHAPVSGRVVLNGEELSPTVQQRSREQRRGIQIVFQNPYQSLNPRHRVRDAIARSAQALRGLSARTAEAEVSDLLARVRLPASIGARFPQELSGGECQRVAIARALAAQPQILVCDEITSALDVSVQAAVLELLTELRDSLGLAMVFISHDLGVVSAIGDRIVVMSHGEVREEGTARSVLVEPTDAYTRRLLAAAPRLDLSRPSTTVPVKEGDE